jgi:hypothetical protein
LTLEQIQRVGVGEACNKHQLFEQQLGESQGGQSKQLWMDWTVSEDPAEQKTFGGGFGALVKWHREQINAERGF